MYNHHKGFWIGSRAEFVSAYVHASVVHVDTVCLRSPPCQVGSTVRSSWSSVLVLEEFPSWFSVQSEASAVSTEFVLLPHVHRDILQHLFVCMHARESCSCAPINQESHFWEYTHWSSLCTGDWEVSKCLKDTGLSCHHPWPNQIHLITDKGYHHQLAKFTVFCSAQLKTSNAAWDPKIIWDIQSMVVSICLGVRQDNLLFWMSLFTYWFWKSIAVLMWN